MPENFSVLIVEDDDDTRQNMEDILSLDGYQLESQAHCLPAIEAVESRHFDAVIIDWKLPDGNGGELIPIIKRELPDSPVIVVTGIREFDTAVTALRNGAYDFLAKPINPDALRRLFDRLVERKNHLAEIDSAQSQLLAKERLAAIGQMVAGLAHESRNAFQRSHACLAELSLDLGEMPDSLNLVRKVQKALDDLHFLLEEVREYSAPIILERRSCNIGEMIEETWKHIREANSTNPNLKIQINQPADVPRVWFVDDHRLRQVIRNLLENALFAAKTDGNIHVELGFQTNASAQPTLLIQVSDDGPGVPVERRQEIFTPFFTTKTKGTGLGLAISRRIVETHAGTLTVAESELGGAKFTIGLPKFDKNPRK